MKVRNNGPVLWLEARHDSFTNRMWISRYTPEHAAAYPVKPAVWSPVSGRSSRHKRMS